MRLCKYMPSSEAEKTDNIQSYYFNFNKFSPSNLVGIQIQIQIQIQIHIIFKKQILSIVVGINNLILILAMICFKDLDRIFFFCSAMLIGFISMSAISVYAIPITGIQFESTLQHVQINRISEIRVYDSRLVFAWTELQILEHQLLNVGAYSTDLMFSMFVDFFDTIQQLNSIMQKTSNQLSQKHQNPTQQQKNPKITPIQKIKQNSRFHHFTMYNRNQLSKSKIFVLIIGNFDFISNSNNNCTIILSISHQKLNLEQIHKGSIYQYYLKKNQTQNITYKYLTKTKSTKNQIAQKTDETSGFWSFLSTQQQNKGLQFYTVHIVGDYSLNVILSYYESFASIAHGKVQSKKSVIITHNYTDSNYFILESFINKKIEKIRSQVEIQTKKYRKSVTKFQQTVSLTFSVTCMSKTQDCIFLNELRLNQSRQLISGIPRVFSLQEGEVQLFYFKNVLDLNFNIKINKKLGIPHYKLCSTTNSNQKENQCTKIMKVKQKQDKFLIEAKEDIQYFFGRGFQLRITPHHQIYCYRCTYFIALFADFDNVQGSISIIHQNSYVLLPQGHSLINIVSKNQPNHILFYSGLQSVIFQRFQGDAFVKLTKILNKKMYNFQDCLSQKSSYYEQKIISISSQTSAFLDLFNSFSTSFIFFQFSTYILTITPLQNKPSLLYSIQTFSLQTNRFMLKDGIPYDIDINQSHSINFKYLCEIQNQNIGSITISSNQIDQLDIKVFGECISQEDTLSYSSKNTNFGIFTKQMKKYVLTEKSYRKNTMINRIDILLEALNCKSYTVVVRGKENSHMNSKKQTGLNINVTKQKQKVISYTVLVSFLDNLLLSVNQQFPGILRYPSKLIQIYEIFVIEKTSLSILINFCKAGSGRLMIYENKNQIFQQEQIRMVQFDISSQLKQFIYLSKPGVFYIAVEFLGLNNILQYTILVKQNTLNYAMYEIFQQKGQKLISYTVQSVSSQQTVYQIQFFQIQLQKLNQDHLQENINYNIEYYILQSNSQGFLTRAVNCKGQFFSDIMGHHEYFREIKIDQKLINYLPRNKSQLRFGQKSQNGKFKYIHKTKNPFSFITIVPKIQIIQSSVLIETPNQHRFFSKNMIIPYWQYTQSSRLPYEPIRLHNGNIYSVIQNLVQQALMFIEQEIVDIHEQENLIITIIIIFGIMCCLYPLQIMIICFYDRIKKYEQEKERLRIEVIALRPTISPIRIQEQQNFGQEQQNFRQEEQMKQAQQQAQKQKPASQQFINQSQFFDE